MSDAIHPDPTAFLGNISDTVVKIFALHAWCADAPIPMSITGIQKLMYPRGCAANTTNGNSAMSSMAFMRPS